MDLRCPDAWKREKMASMTWCNSFIKRYQNRTPQFSLNPNLFHNLYEVLSKTAITPSSIWTMNEFGFSSVPKKADKVLSLNASGDSIPPVYIFPSHKMETIVVEQDAVGLVNYSGWMQQSEFVTFMKHFIVHSCASPERPAFLLLDKHGSYLSVEALDLADKHGVRLIPFPIYCTQPMNVSAFGTIATIYAQLHNAWMRNNAEEVSEMCHICHIPLLVEKCLPLALTPTHIMHGFRATGISPFNPVTFCKMDSMTAELNGEHLTAVESEPIKRYQRHLPSPSTSVTPPAKRANRAQI